MTLQDCICFQLGRLSKEISRHYRDRIAEFSLTHSQFFMLMAVVEFEGSQPSQLAEKTFTDRSTTTGLVDRLERDGWVERRPGPEDRRTLRIFLSAKAKKHKNGLKAIFKKINGSFIKRFTDEEWRQLRYLLGKLES